MEVRKLVDVIGALKDILPINRRVLAQQDILVKIAGSAQLDGNVVLIMNLSVTTSLTLNYLPVRALFFPTSTRVPL